MYNFIYQICTLPKNDKFEVRKIIFREKKFHSHEEYNLSYSQINNLLDNINENDYIKIDTDTLNNINDFVNIEFTNINDLINKNLQNINQNENNKNILYYH